MSGNTPAPAAPAAPLFTKADIARHMPWVYAIYSLLNATASTMALTHMQFYITQYTGITINNFVAVVTVARFADLGVSLIAGPIIQRQARMRPWVWGTYVVSGLGTIACFLNPPVSVGAKLAIIAVFYCFIHFPMNFATVSVSTLQIKVVGPNPYNRLAITAMTTRVSSAWRIVTSATVVPTIVALNNIFPNGRGYTIMTVILACMSFAAVTVLYIFTKPYEPKDTPKPTVTGAQTNPLKMYASAAKSFPLMVLLGCSMLTGIAGQVVSSGAQYYWNFSVGNLSLQAVQTTIGSFVSLGLSMFMPQIARKMVPKQTSVINYFWTVAWYFVIFFFADGRPYHYMVFGWMNSISTSLSGAWGNQLWVNAAEVDYYETGLDNRPFIMSLSNLPIKMGFIISGPFTAWMLNNTGYELVDGLGTMSDTSRFVKIWYTIPIVLWALAALLFTFGYRVKQDYAVECAVKNKEAAAARAAAAAGAAPATN